MIITATENNNNYLKTTGILLFAIFLFACGGSDLTDFEYVQRAKASISENNSNSAIIDLKNALKINANNAEARFLLGNTYVYIGDAISAEKELLKANTLGIPKSDIATPLAKSLFILNRHNEILNSFKEIHDYPQNIQAEIYLIKGQSFYKTGEHKKAEEVLLAVAESHKDSLYEIKSKAFLSFYGKNYEESEKWVEKALSINPKSPDMLLLKGDVLFAQSKYKEASIVFSTLSDLQTSSLVPRILLGISQLNNNDSETAITTFKNIIAQIPNNPLANYFLASAYLKEKKFEEAKTFAEKSLVSDPANLRSRLIAGVSNYMLKNYEQSMEHLKQFTAKVPEHEIALKTLAATQSKLGFTDQAILTLSKVTTLSEDDATLLASIADEAVSGGDLRTGKEFFQKAAKLSRNSPIMLASLGLTKVSAGEIEDGLKNIEEAAKSGDFSSNIQLSLILTYIQTERFDEAISASIKFQQENPQNPDGYTLQGIAYGGKNQLEKAKLLFEKALNIQPGNANASSNLASYYLAQNDTLKAQDALKAALKINPGNPKLSISLSKLHSKEGEFEKSIEILENSNNLFPNNVDTKITLASNYFALNQANKVLNILNPIEAEGKTYPAYLEIKGRAELIEKQYESAISTFTNLVSLKPTEASFFFYLATAFSEFGDSKSAKSNLQKAVSLNPKHELYRLNYIKTLVSLQETKSAKAQIKKLNPKSQKLADILVLRGKIALVEKKPEKASSYFKQALDKNEINSINILYARSLYALGETQESFDVLNKWLKLYPEDAATHKVIAELYLERNEHELALSSFNRVLELSPNDYVALNNAAWLQFKAGRLNKAKSLAKKANTIKPNDPTIQDTYGMILLEMGEIQEAKNLLEKSSRYMPDNLNTRYHIALAYFKEGNEEESKVILQNILDEKNSAGFTYKDDASSLLKRINNQQ